MAVETPCYLSALAPELVANIFNQLDSIRALGNLITTSRYVHQIFEGRRETIVSRVLQNELDLVLVDARFLRGFPYDGNDGKPHARYFNRIHSAALVYRDMLNNSRHGVDDVVLTREELTELCRTLHTMNFLADIYIAAQRRRLDGGSGSSAEPPSRSERLRVLRAFYRRQIICNAWAPTEREPGWGMRDVAAMSNTSTHQGVRLGLLSAFEPWELEQIDHINFFTMQLCAALCTATETTPAAAAAAPATETTQRVSQDEFGQLMSHVDRLARYLQRHPILADAALRDVVPPSEEVCGGADDIATTFCRFTRRYRLHLFDSYYQNLRERDFPDPERDVSEQHQAGQDEDTNTLREVKFVGDSVDQPPFAWVDAFGGRYVNQYGAGLESIGEDAIGEDGTDSYPRFVTLLLWRATGFAFWDRWRVESIKKQDKWAESLRTGWMLE